MSEDEEEVGEEGPDGGFIDLERTPSVEEKIAMRKASKPPSEWLKLLCKEWAIENEVLVETADAKFLDYKPYLKGLLTSQLLCRLSVPPVGKFAADFDDFWEILGVNDAFDRAYIVAQIERFCSLYNIRGIPMDEAPVDPLVLDPDAASIAAATAASLSVSPAGNADLHALPHHWDPHVLAAATPTATAVTSDAVGRLSKKQCTEVTRARCAAKDAEKALFSERKAQHRRDQKRITQERKEQKEREREEAAAQKAAERTNREATREDRRRKKLEQRLQRERFAQQQKEAALKRAAELVSSNRVPIEITRGAQAAKAAQERIEANSSSQPAPPQQPTTKKRSAVVVSTAADLDQIVTHSKNLWAKYNAIAKEHNQKVNWITVARELGIHVKVREKYARMHSRAVQRGFDWERNGHWKIKDHPEIFHEPTQAEQKAKMPPPPPEPSRTVLVEGTKEVVSDEADEAAATAASIVDAAVNSPSKEDDGDGVGVAEETALVADPTADVDEYGSEEEAAASNSVCV